MIGEISIELIKKLMAVCHKDKIDVELPILLNKAAYIRTLVEQNGENLEAESERHESMVNKLNNALKEIQNDCPHNASTYHPDPSGNNDSYYSCDICGKEI